MSQATLPPTKPSRVKQLADAILAQESELSHPEPQPPHRILPAVIALAKEIGHDPLLAEATLAWVQKKKRELIQAQLIALRGREWVEAEMQRMEGGERK